MAEDGNWVTVASASKLAPGDIKDAKYVWYKFHDGKYAEDPSLQ